MKIVKGLHSKPNDQGVPFEYNLWTGNSFASARNAWIDHWMAKTKINFDSTASEFRKNGNLISLLVDLYVESYKVSFTIT